MREFGFGFGNLQLNFQIARRKGGGNDFEPAGPTWQGAVRASAGYAAAEIFEKAISAARQVRDGKAAFERDTVLFQQPEYSHQMLAWMLLARLRLGKLSVLDFGGGFGSRYFQHKSVLQELGLLRWAVVEQDNIVDAGQAEFITDELKFFRTIEEAEGGVTPNFLMMSGVLQYLERPYAMLEILLARGYPHFLLDRTMARSGVSDELFIQHVPLAIYQGSYPVWFLDARRVEQLVQSYGYRLVERVDPHPGSTFGLQHKRWPYVSWYFERDK